MKSLITVLIAITSIATQAAADSGADHQLKQLKQYMQCSKTISLASQYLPQNVLQTVKTTESAEHTDIWWSKKDQSNVHVRIDNKNQISTQAVAALDQPEASLQPLTAENRNAFLTSLTAAYREHIVLQLKAITPAVLADAANQPAGFTAARDNFRKAYLSGQHPCDEIRERTISSNFALAEDTVLAGFIQMSQQINGHRAAANTEK